MVGKSGLEQYYESYLRGKNGEKQVYVNNVGKINEVISQENPVSGNDVYLSIDIKLQEATYKLLEQEIAGIVYSKIKSGEIPASSSGSEESIKIRTGSCSVICFIRSSS